MRELVVPALLIAYLAAYAFQVRGLPIASTLYPYLIGGAIACGLVFIFWQSRSTLASFASQSRPDADVPDVASAAAGNEAIRPPADKARAFDAHRLRALRLPVLFLVACALYPVALASFGFALSTVVFVTLLLRAFGGEPWLRAGFIAIGVAVVFFLFVDKLLGVPLPRFSYAVLPLGL